MQTPNTFALIIGGSKGLGLGATRKLSREGYQVLVLHRDRKKDLPGVQAEFDTLREEGGLIHSYHMDALKKEERTSWIASVKELLGDDKIGVVVFSIAKGNLKAMTAGKGSPCLTGMDFALTSEGMAFALYDWISDLIRGELLAGDTRIIAFTSEGSRKILPRYGAVAAAKAALEAIVRQMAVEWAPIGIKANCIQAGVTETDSFNMIPGAGEILAESKSRNPSGRLTTPADVGDVVYLLTRKEAAWITGTIICADGGESLC